MADSNSVKLEYVAAGCNRVVGALDWCEEGLIAYCAHHAIAIYNPATSSIISTLLGHTDTVTCLRWFKTSDFGLESKTNSSSLGSPGPQTLALASGGGDGSICIWVLTLDNPNHPWTLAATLPAHKAAITSISIHNAGSPGQIVLVTTAGDGDVSIWSTTRSITHPTSLLSSSLDTSSPVSSTFWNEVQCISYGTKLQHCSAITALPSDHQNLILALGGVDGKVRLLLSSSSQSTTTHSTTNENFKNSTSLGEFKLVCELAGHQNWVRGLAFTYQKDGDDSKNSKILLASASQDRYIRLWAITPNTLSTTDLHSTSKSSTTGSSTNLAASLMRFAPRPRFTISSSGVTYQASLEALLIGHEDWVHSVAWKPRSSGGENGLREGEEEEDVPCLLSASMDRTMALWVPDKATGIWLSQESVGDAGVNHLGYYTGVWNPDGTSIVAHGFTGALHLWNRTEDGDLIPQPAVGGHCNQIVDACWGVDGGCLLTVSTDQTARMTTKLKNMDKWCEIARPQVHGHDFSCVAALPNFGSRHEGQQREKERGEREEDFSQEGEINRYLYVSGSEEKVLRVFEAPGAFAETLAMARGKPLPSSQFSTSQSGFAPSTPAYGASLPALGLSNKAIYSEEDASTGVNTSGSTEPGLGDGGYNEYGPDVAPNAAPTAIAGPPLEEHLAGSTLWPEIHKLYGHGNEIYCVAAHPSGRFLASACRAQSTSTAGILIWDTKTWRSCTQLEAHSLTVTQLAFSPNGKFLASGSRDRTLAIFSMTATPGTATIDNNNLNDAGDNNKNNSDNSDTFSLVSHVKAHARIVWGVSWAPNSRLLATASRDGTAKIWQIDGDTGCCVGSTAAITLQFKIGVQCVAFAPRELSRDTCLAAVGLENGLVVIGIVSWKEIQKDSTGGDVGSNGVEKEESSMSSSSSCLEVGWNEIWRTPVVEKHAAAVRRVCWRVADDEEDENRDVTAEFKGKYKTKFDLASVSDDHSIRIFNVDARSYI